MDSNVSVGALPEADNELTLADIIADAISQVCQFRSVLSNGMAALPKALVFSRWRERKLAGKQ